MRVALKARVSTPAPVYYTSDAFSPLRDSRANFMGFYTRMLTEDISNREYAYDLEIGFAGISKRDGEALIQAVLCEFARYGREPAIRLLMLLASSVGRDHVLYGRSLAEVYAEASGEPCLAVLPGWSLRSRRGRIEQAYAHGKALRWQILPKEGLVDFKLPGTLGKQLYQANRRLSVLDRARPGEPDLLNSASSTGYDFNLHREALDLLAARATASIGWPGRDAFLGRATNSYKTFRELKFRLTWLKVVLATAERVSAVLNSRPDINEEITIRILGLPTAERIEAAMAAVTTGEESLDAIFKSVLHPR